MQAVHCAVLPVAATPSEYTAHNVKAADIDHPGMRTRCMQLCAELAPCATRVCCASGPCGFAYKCGDARRAVRAYAAALTDVN